MRGDFMTSWWLGSFSRRALLHGVGYGTNLSPMHFIYPQSILFGI
jgi:hypothetical protein